MVTSSTSSDPLPPSVASTHFAPRRWRFLAAQTAPATVAAVAFSLAPTSNASSTSFGQTMLAALSKASSTPPGGTGAVFRTETQPAASASSSARSVVA